MAIINAKVVHLVVSEKETNDRVVLLGYLHNDFSVDVTAFLQPKCLSYSFCRERKRSFRVNHRFDCTLGCHVHCLYHDISCIWQGHGKGVFWQS